MSPGRTKIGWLTTQSAANLSRRQKQGKIQGNLEFRMESRGLGLAGAGISGILARSLTKDNREGDLR
jgi:hypothetical protein